jgi:hypothetical protein
MSSLLQNAPVSMLPLMLPYKTPLRIPIDPRNKLQDYVYEYRRYLQVIFWLYTALKRLSYLDRGLA